MTNELVYRFSRNENEDISFSVREFKERLYCDIRIFFKASDNEWHPTKKGITFRIDLLPEVQKGISKLIAFCSTSEVSK